MNREQQKAYNADNYPASVLTWLNEATDRAFDYLDEQLFLCAEKNTDLHAKIIHLEDKIENLQKEVKYWKLSFNKQVEASRS